MNTRRQFLIKAPLGIASVAVACRGNSEQGAGSAPPSSTTPGAPVAFGTAAGSGPEVSAATFAEAEKLMQLSYTDAERTAMVGAWRRTLSATLERRTGPRKVPMTDDLVPAMLWDPARAVGLVPSTRDRFVRSIGNPGPLPASDADIAFAPVSSLSRWIERKQLTSVRLTNIYLDRIARFDGTLRCVITVTRDRAVEQAKAADAEIARGKYRGPLHGIPFGVKDLLDTAGIATTYGAEPFRNRVPTRDSVVVERLQAAGAVSSACIPTICCKTFS